MERTVAKGNVMNQECIRRNIVRETEKAYLVDQSVNNRRDGSYLNFRWVAKKFCKDRQKCIINGTIYADTVLVPEWLVPNGVW